MLNLILAQHYDTEVANGSCAFGRDQFCPFCVGQKCKICYHSYNVDGQCVQPATEIENCLSYSNATTCSACKLKYHLEAGRCERITLNNCLSSVGRSCLICDGFIESESNTTCTSKGCSIENCSTCFTKHDEENCLFCKIGFGISKDKKSCVKPTGKYSGCTQSDDCTICDYGYYVSSLSTSEEIRCSRSVLYQSAKNIKFLFVGLLIILELNK